MWHRVGVRFESLLYHRNFLGGIGPVLLFQLNVPHRVGVARIKQTDVASCVVLNCREKWFINIQIFRIESASIFTQGMNYHQISSVDGKVSPLILLGCMCWLHTLLNDTIIADSKCTGERKDMCMLQLFWVPRSVKSSFLLIYTSQSECCFRCWDLRSANVVSLISPGLQGLL